MTPWRGRLVERAAMVVGLAVVGLAAFLAARADAARPQASVWITALDVLTGLMFVGGAVASVGPRKQRWMMALVGAAWLVGSIAPALSLLHQAVLLVALMAFPAGDLRRWLVLVSGVLAVPVALGLLSQIGVAAVFAVFTAVSVVHRSRDGATRVYPAVALGALSIVLALAWVSARAGFAVASPQLVLVAYVLLLLGIAATFPLATHALARRRRRLADQALGGRQGEGLVGLAQILRRTLGDPDLAISPWHPGLGGYVDHHGRKISGPASGRSWLEVVERGDRLGVVEYRSVEMTDPHTQAAVASAVRLVTRNEQLQDQQQREVAELEASRTRLLDAADRARQRVAAQLRNEVEGSLAVALATVDDLRAGAADPALVATLGVAYAELVAVHSELSAIVSGVPSVELGDGGLRLALERLAEMCPVPVRIAISDDAIADREAETALFYVCSEALTNSAKHAEASATSVTLERQPTALMLAVADDGVGGADPSGAGLRGLADRLASVGGRLQVRSTPGAGTQISAQVPWPRG